VEVTGDRCYFRFEKKTVKRSVQCHVFAQSPPGRHPREKYRVTTHRSQFVFAVLLGSNGNSCTVSAQSDMCTHVHQNIQTLVGPKK